MDDPSLDRARRLPNSLRMAFQGDPYDTGFPSDWNRHLVRDRGPEWQAAIAFGIDVSLLLENSR